MYEVTSFQLDEVNFDEVTMSPNQMNKRNHLKRYEKYRETKNSRYAVKHIKESYFGENDGVSYVQAAR